MNNPLKKICFIVPDGVGIRNYLFSDLISQFDSNQTQFFLWHKLDPSVIKSIEELHGIQLISEELISIPESLFPRVFREASVLARLKRNVEIDQNPATIRDWPTNQKSLKRKLLYKFAEIIASSVSKYDNILWLESYSEILSKRSKAFTLAQEFLKRTKPEIVFCTHQRSPDAAIALLAARSLGIKTMTVIFSWDNLPKARLAVKADNYLVWSNYMKEELHHYYPEINDSQVIVTGTPQFNFYSEEKFFVSKEEFASKYGLDPKKKWICFSGDDEYTSPLDPYFLRDLALALKDETQIQILFRPVPVSKYDRYQKVLDEFKNIVLISPLWKLSDNWSYSYPLYEDLGLLANVAKHCETVLNIGSTMALDFACFDKPAIYLNYLPDCDNPTSWDPYQIYQRQHFRSMDQLDAVCWINQKEEIGSVVQRVLNSPKEICKDRLVWLNKIRKDFPQSTSTKMIFETIKSI
jgi:hypothetical protein